MIIDSKKIFLTGGTGSFGKAFVKIALKKTKVKKIIIFSRDESKQWDMQHKFNHDKRLEFVIGDVRDEKIITKSMRGSHYVVHAAATKIVPTAETNPYECIKTNVLGSMNVINAATENNVQKVVALSTDKACNPANLYGATKLCADKLFISERNYLQTEKTKFAVVRYGNVLGSRGSVVPFFKSLQDNQPIPITDTRMTRFVISLEECVNFVFEALSNMHGGEIFVKKIPSIKVIDIAKAIRGKKTKTKIIGIRAGEKLHEEMISEHDSDNTYEFKNYYKIISANISENKKKLIIKNAKKVRKGFFYRSDQNKVWVNHKFLNTWIKRYPEYI